jgi:hypothetical protein|uniref:Uncharacterized protein n=1 Tax=viral metagenome TaxID=1070528 RepID=A0A6C0DPT2_9ZZZZ
MEYYLVSLVISVLIFIFIYDNKPLVDEYGNLTGEKTSITSTNNIILFLIVYIVSTILSFYIFTASSSLSSFYPSFLSNILTIPEAVTNYENYENIDEIDPKILSKITDNIDIGFGPIENENE